MPELQRSTTKRNCLLQILHLSNLKAINKIAKLLFVNLAFFACLLSSLIGQAQQKVAIDDRVNQHIFSYDEIECLEDPKGLLNFN